MRHRLTALLAVGCALVIGACGVGAGEGSDDVSLLVTQDFGAGTVGEVGPEPVQGSETVMRLLERSFDVQTRYGGGFVQSIDGLEGGRAGGRPVDWFFYVNGIEAEQGSASTELHGGDRIWWDYRDWGGAQRVPAVVGQFPEPFANGLDGKKWTTRVECVRGQEKDGPCDDVADRLGEVGAIPAKSLVGTEGGDENTRVLVGAWEDLRFDRAARLIDEGPRASGVFAKFSEDGRELVAYDGAGQAKQTLGAGTGLIAATRYEDQPPTWFVTGTDAAGVEAAVRALEEGALGKHYALAISDDRAVSLPVRGAPQQ